MSKVTKVKPDGKFDGKQDEKPDDMLNDMLWAASMMQQESSGIWLDKNENRLVEAIVKDGLIPVHNDVLIDIDGRSHLIMAGEDPFGEKKRTGYELVDGGKVRRFFSTPPPLPPPEDELLKGLQRLRYDHFDGDEQVNKLIDRLIELAGG